MNSTLNYKKIKTIKSNDLKLMPNKTFDIEDKRYCNNGHGFIKVNRWANVTIYSYSEDIVNVRNKNDLGGFMGIIKVMSENLSNKANCR